jgi:predicted RNA-binding protein with PIN domain
VKIYLIDACNYIYAEIENVELNKGLETLIKILNEVCLQTGEKIIAFIDGEEKSFLNCEMRGKVLCIFTPSADNEIVKYLQKHKNEKNTEFIVVTSDAELKRRCQKEGAKVISSQELTKYYKSLLTKSQEEAAKNTDYLKKKQNPDISEKEAEELYKEFLNDTEE